MSCNISVINLVSVAIEIFVKPPALSYCVTIYSMMGFSVFTTLYVFHFCRKEFNFTRVVFFLRLLGYL